MSKYHILICDDEEIIRESVKAYLEDDFEISLAENGLQAIELTKTEDFGVIIMDIKLGGDIDGINAIKEIKKFKPDQKIIVLTGYESVDSDEEALKLGVSSYLVKPIGRAKLLKIIEDILK
ncbi:MAG: response regulator [Candidatus Omnitrophota bacterium]